MRGSLPPWFPRWAHQLGELYSSGTTSMFVLSGNTFDLLRCGGEGEGRYGTLAEFLGEQVFGRWDLVLHYDLARGLRCFAGRSEERLKEMVPRAARRMGDLPTLAKDPTTVLALLDRFVTRNVLADEKERLSAAVLIDHASFIAPRLDVPDQRSATHLVTLLNWASSPYVKRLNMAFVLVESRQADVSERLLSNPHVAHIEVTMPGEEERADFLRTVVGDADLARAGDFTAGQIASFAAGISLTDLNVLVRSSLETGRRLDAERFRQLKKRLIERQAGGMLEFLEPKWGLDMVVGHEAAKERLRQDAELVGRGALHTVPMGYLVCGPVGTGKSFLSQCVSGSLGIPCVTLRNFRSKYVGETEGNLERILSVLRSMGPVVVVVDEADAVLGSRESGGDSGVSGRVFGMIASQMGDTRFRGKILWMLLTARPDLLPIDLKRQGRAEVHIPLFYPVEAGEIRRFFVVMAQKTGAALLLDDVPPVPYAGDLSGADIEGIVGRAWRGALLAGEERITRERLAAVLESFLPSTLSLERELQEIAAVVECTDREFLPPRHRAAVEEAGGGARLQERLAALKRTVDAL